MFSSSFYEKLDPSYREALEKLENNLTFERNRCSISQTITPSSCDLIREFSFHYLTPKKLLQILWNKSMHNTSTPFYPNIMYHFSFQDDIKFTYIATPRTKLLEKSYHKEICEKYHGRITVKDLCFPHNLLEHYLHSYESRSKSPLPTKIITCNLKMRKLYNKIQSVEGNDEKWINAMAEADDIEFVKQNIEYKLGQDLTNKNLWILYIKYLKENDIQGLLQTYSKYCRFFIDDFAMKEEYAKAVEKYGKPTVSWKNRFDFEIFDESLSKFEYPKSNYDTPSSKDPCLLNFDSQTSVFQIFPFYANLMDYIVKKAKAPEVQKLNFSCKYFFNKYRMAICCQLIISSPLPQVPQTHYKKESLYIASNTQKSITNFKNLYVSTRFSYIRYFHSGIPLRNMIPKIYKCNAKFIRIERQELFLKELTVFIGHGNVVNLCLDHVTVLHANGEPVYLEDILVFTPKLQKLSVFNLSCSSKTAQKLCEFTFENKFMDVTIRHEKSLPLDPIAFGKFVVKNASPLCKIFIAGVENNFKNVFQSIIEKYWTKDYKHQYQICSFN